MKKAKRFNVKKVTSFFWEGKPLLVLERKGIKKTKKFEINCLNRTLTMKMNALLGVRK
ncbi:MAG: hypothetical protein IJM09_03765 [Neisseriaceae bacterium]|nr:hypothetical protein [Neisseriaceae bacterium]